MKFSLRSNNSSKKSSRSLRDDSASVSSSMSSSERRNKPEFVAASMKQMEPHQVIEMLEMYAAGADNDYAYDCFQSLKNSEPLDTRRTGGNTKRKHKSTKANAAA